VNAWAQDKTWLVCHSLLVGRPQVQGREEELVGLARATVEGFYYKFTGSAAGNPRPRLYVPAKFSVALGGAASVAPHDYIPKEAAQALGKLNYTAWGPVPSPTPNSAALVEHANIPGGDVNESLPALRPTHSAATKNPVDAAFPKLTNVGALSVLDASTASSAVAGGIGLIPAFLFGESAAGLSLTPRATLADVGDGVDPFKAATKLVKGLFTFAPERDVTQLRDAQAVALADGGYTENTGVAQAIAVGADEVVLFMHFSADTLHEFTDSRPKVPDPMGDVYNLFEGGFENGISLHQEYLYYQLFTESRKDVESKTVFHNLTPPPRTSGTRANGVKGVSYGTVTGTTKASPWFGIKEGRSVKLNIIRIQTPLDIGFRDRAELYSDFVGGVFEWLTFNDGEVRDKLGPWFGF